MSVLFKVTRRDFLRQAGLGGGALVLGCVATGTPLSASGILGKIITKTFPLNPFVGVRLDGTIVIMAHRSEMGQGIRSSLAAVLADELEADWARIVVLQAEADGPRYAIANPHPGGTPKFPISEEAAQFADSSRSMALYFQPMRLIGAGIRLVLIRAAARKFGVDPAECWAKQHTVVHGRSGRSADYSDLLLEARKVPLPTVPEVEAALKPEKEWRFIGKQTMPFVDAQDMVTGKAVYGADIHRPGMLTAVILRCPVANGTVRNFDPNPALAVPGVRFVTEVLPRGSGGGVGQGFTPHAGVAVLAENTWAALQGRRALKVEWDLSQQPAAQNARYHSEPYRGELEASTAQPGKTLRAKGDVDAAIAAAPRVVKADYYVPHLAQAPMEPPVAVALFENGRFEIWSPTQGPELTQHYVGLTMLEPDPVKWLAWQVTEPTELVKEHERKLQIDFNEKLGKLLGLDQPALFNLRDQLKKNVRDKVKVHVTLLGGGFGRKSKPDYAIEAACLARQHPGVPIRVQWTREDDLQFSYFHAVSHQHLEAALDGAGHATAWLQRSAFPSFFASLFPGPLPGVPEIFQTARAAYHNGGVYPFGSGIERAQGLEDMPFDLTNLRLENCPAQSHIRVGWMRSVSNIYHAFAIASFADELAIAAGRDSKDYLLELIGRGRVLDLEAEGVQSFDNNGFPAMKWEGTPPIVPPYPPDTRRLRSVIERVAREAGWDEKVQRYKTLKGRGLGIAAHRSFLSYAAMVIDVSLNEANELTVHDVFAVIDCGLEVNPDRIKAQMEGGIIYGLSLALLGEITVKGGAVEQHNFDDYPVVRLRQAPKNIYTYFEPPSEEVRKEMGEVRPTGVGEIPVPPVAPALANAIVAAGGPRIRELPLCESWDKDDGKVPRVPKIKLL
ncbi:MAG: molybdopterin-dependent oxidoreductase [Acidobacteriota bacterium]|nr:molybdopterin-dependent oxidoreductase [Acidobacteriota bacterium]